MTSLDQRIADYAAQGWRLTARTETTAQLIRPRFLSPTLQVYLQADAAGRVQEIRAPNNDWVLLTLVALLCGGGCLIAYLIQAFS